MLSIDKKVVREAKRLMKEYNLKHRDAIHAACAIKNDIKEIVNDNSDFNALKARRIQLDELTKFESLVLSVE